MAKAIIDEQNLTDIADAIRAKNGSADTYTPSEMATAITDLPNSIFNGSIYGTLPINYRVAEATNSTTLTASIECNIGDVIVCCFATRNCPTPTLSNGWTLEAVSEINNADTYKQRLNWARKTAESTEETITVTQTNAGRLYINLIALPSTVNIAFNEFTYFSTARTSFSLPKTNDICIWGATAPLWQTTSPYPLWEASNIQYLIQLDSSTQPRLLNGIDITPDDNVVFSVVSSTTAIFSSITVTSI